MKVPVKLLPNCVDQGRVFVLRERIDPLCPERDGEADQEDRLDQNNRKFQVSRDAAGYTVMVCHRVTTFVKTPEDEKEKCRPSEKERAHEPMTELDDVIDLIAMLGGIRWQADQFVDQGETSHISPSLRRSTAHAAQAGRSRGARGAHRKRSLRQAPT